MTVPVDPKDAAQVAGRKRDFDDLQNELAGRETGRQERFFPGDERSASAERKKQGSEQAFRSMLDMLLADPVYRARYEQVMTRLREAEQATEAALDRISNLIGETEDAVRDMEDRAAKLPDGTMVFRDANGVVRRADGSVVEAYLVDTILWSGNEPSYEDYRAQQDRLADLEESRAEVERYRDDVLGPARDRITDASNPPSLDELDAIMDDIENEMPEIAREPAPSHAEAPEVESGQIAIPTLPTGR